MIYKVLNNADIEQLKSELEAALPGTAKIYYVIRNVVLGYLDGFEIIVDNWPDWKCILLRPEAEDKVLSYFRFTHICHAKSVCALKYFLQRPGVINWNQPINFTGVPNDVIPVLSEVCRKHGGQLTSKESRLMYAWSKASVPVVPEIPPGLQLSSLDKSHVGFIQKDWEQKGRKEDLEAYFTSVIEKFESSCLLDENQQLLAYVCMQYNGSMAMLYVRPEYRKEGYFHILLSDLTRKILAKNGIAYGFIPIHDTSLINLARELGFEWFPQGNMTWSRYIPKNQSNPQSKYKGVQEPIAEQSITEERLSTENSNSLIKALPLQMSVVNF